MTSTIKNPKEHFICYDGLCNVSLDLNFSVFRKYRCQAGCAMCYIKNDFLPNADFNQYIPEAQDINSVIYKDRLKRLFSYFKTVMAIDDLPYLKNEHPELYRFYLELGYPIRVCLSDNAIFRYRAISGDNKGSYGFQDISLSDGLLSRVQCAKIFSTLSVLQHTAGISKIKLIIDGQYQNEDRHRLLINWAAANDIVVEKKFALGVEPVSGSKILDTVSSAQYSDDRNFTEVQNYSENGDELYPIHSESLFLMGNDFYSELKSATRDDRSPPFATLVDFDDPVKFLAKVLRGKVHDYARYVGAMTDYTNHYYRYFKYVVDHLVINDDFNFIPAYLMPGWSMYRQRILESGKLQMMQYGLFDHTATQPISICEFKNHGAVSIQD